MGRPCRNEHTEPGARDSPASGLGVSSDYSESSFPLGLAGRMCVSLISLSSLISWLTELFAARINSAGVGSKS